MDKLLIDTIMQLDPPGTIYFSKMEYKGDRLDQYFYRVIGRYLIYSDQAEVMAAKDKGDHFRTILLAWQRLLRESLDTEHTIHPLPVSQMWMRLCKVSDWKRRI